MLTQVTIRIYLNHQGRNTHTTIRASQITSSFEIVGTAIMTFMKCWPDTYESKTNFPISSAALIRTGQN